jgi:hypothetical protein
MSEFIYAFAFAVIILWIVGHFTGLFSILAKKLKSIHFKVDFSDKDK